MNGIKPYYTIISIGDTRAGYKANIHNRVDYPFVNVPGVNGSIVDLNLETEKRNIKVVYSGMFSQGEIGVWLSNMDCWKYAVDNDQPLIIFEDDAIPHPQFTKLLDEYMERLPEDWSFMALWVPPNQMMDYNYNVAWDDEGKPHSKGMNLPDNRSLYNFGDEVLCHAYQGYGAVAYMVSPAGAARLLDLAQSSGIYTPLDCFIYQENHSGRLPGGYAPKPRYATLVSYDWPETTVHNTERFVCAG